VGAWRGVSVYADRGIGADAIRVAASAPTDVVIVDCLLAGALTETVAAGLPVISLVHTMWSFFESAVAAPFGALIRLRGTTAAAALHAPELSIVTVREDFEIGTAASDSVRHVGVVWQGTPVAANPAPDSSPRVLVSLSTMFAPGQDRAMQAILDGLAGLDIEVIATTGPAIDPAGLRVPANATVHRYVDHAELLPGTTLVVSHGGHGTVARALAHGIPVVVMPMNPLIDQTWIGKAVERLGVGRMLPKSAKPAVIRAAVSELLGSASHRGAAARIGESIREGDGADRASELIEAFAVSRLSQSERP
jgi:MGT family glycosyltransferase